MINQDQFRTLWPQIKVGLLNLWGRLDSAELDNTRGDFSAIAEIVQERYGEDNESIRAKLDNLMKSFDNDTDKGTDPDVSSYKRSPTPNEDWNARH